MNIGCAACYGEDPQAAWRHCRTGLERTAELVDESHFMVSIRRCGICSQHYLWIFTEMVDWAGGEDAQHHLVVPVTVDEATALVEQGGDPDLTALGALGHDRRYLVVDWPTGARDQRITWSSGRFVIMPGH